MEESLAEVRGLADSILGGSDAAVSIPRQRIRELRALALILEEPAASPDALARLLRACRTLDHVRLDKLADKYRTMLQRVGERLGKRLEFRAVPEDLEVPPGLFAALDTPLVHLLRNAADHGIEMEATRLLHGKPGVGRIQLAFNRGESGWEISVSDDGDGIDVEALARKAAAKGLVDTERLASMDEAAKRELIFLPGLSSRDHSTEISGMGIGMDAVAAWAGRAAGEVSVESRAGQGTRITLRLPKAFTGEV
jgi:two-component system chemotaxis sensor kinase CheA